MTGAACHDRLDDGPAEDARASEQPPHDHRPPEHPPVDTEPVDTERGDSKLSDTEPSDIDAAPVEHRTPLYSRVLRLRRIRLRTWQRVLLGDGALLLAVLVVLADLASAWTLVVLPLAVAAFVKAHDLTAGVLARPVRPA